MITLILFMNLLTLCPESAATKNGLGVREIPPRHAEQAVASNAEGKAAYKKENFADALNNYSKAVQADASMESARFNVSCVLSRLNRSVEAIESAKSLIETSCVPWAAAIKESADLAVLSASARWRQIEDASRYSCRRWGEAAQKGVAFIGRSYPPVRVNGDGVLVLQLHQEIYSYQPQSGRYLQLTAENGSVLAMTMTPDRTFIVYVTGKKVIATPGKPRVLRGLAVRTVDLSTMGYSAPAMLPSDVRHVSIAVSNGRMVEVDWSDEHGTQGVYRLADGTFEQLRQSVLPKGVRRILLSGHGAADPHQVAFQEGRCRFSARDMVEGDVPSVEIVARKEKFFLKARFGAGLFGLPFPSEQLTLPQRGN